MTSSNWVQTLLNLQSQEAFNAVLDLVAEHYDNEAKNLSLDSAQTKHWCSYHHSLPKWQEGTVFIGSATASISGIT